MSRATLSIGFPQFDATVISCRKIENVADRRGILKEIVMAVLDGVVECAHPLDITDRIGSSDSP